MDLSKRNALIASLTAADGSAPRTDVLTAEDQAAIAAARADELSLPPEQRSAPVTVPDDEEQDIVIEMDLLLRWQDLFLAPVGKGLNVVPLWDSPEAFAGLSPAGVFEQLILRERQREAGPIQTVDVRAFFDGNTDRSSIAPNVVDSEHGPTFEMLRETLLRLTDRDDVFAVGIEIHELPNPDVAADNDIWLAAERVFIWTRQPLRVVKEWIAPLRPDGMGRASVKAVATPDPTPVPKGIRVYEIAWD